MPTEIDRESVLDDEHLRLLSISYMIMGGFSALFSFLGLLYLFIGTVLVGTLSRLPQNTSRPGEMPPEFVGWIFGAIGLGLFCLLAGMAVLKFWAASCLRRRKSRTFCMVVAALSCLEFPYGTALGVFTFIVLSRPSVERKFYPNYQP